MFLPKILDHLEVAKIVLDKCVVEGPHMDEPQDVDYGVVYNYEYIDDYRDEDEKGTNESASG